jgi:hypothetical protein
LVHACVIMESHIHSLSVVYPQTNRSIKTNHSVRQPLPVYLAIRSLPPTNCSITTSTLTARRRL